MPSGLLVVVRLNHGNKEIQDYIVLPTSRMAGPYLRLSDASLPRHRAIRVENLEDLIRDIIARLTRRKSGR